ncbi:hypothetical protein EUTSA_v10011805mg [Eutrema salsugineum]|uniref:Phytocyanin domain-containing protein n=1 Tax=Eutrema salsugineum TaxID=72664 RepID=V4KSM5_EUTSA|nr:early nodulin-like protein 3 [Eutrema salsugineum]ESQ30378.1 hypothetical protein EUTSA_v10011805mg [Eutrema salsugineum]
MLYRLLFLVCLLVIIHTVCAREFVVGGSKGWTVPSDHQLYNQWAEQSRFQINDSLLFVYRPNQDSVLQVTRDAYDSCNTDGATSKFTDGHTSFTLDRSGPYYFISGDKDKCHKNQKLVIIVMADRSSSNTTTPSSPPPSPSVESSPSPSYTGTFEITPAPSQETPGNTASPSSSSLLPSALIVTLFLSLFS